MQFLNESSARKYDMIAMVEGASRRRGGKRGSSIERDGITATEEKKLFITIRAFSSSVNFKLNEEGCAMSLHRRRRLVIACYVSPSPLPAISRHCRLCVAVAVSVWPLPTLCRCCRVCLAIAGTLVHQFMSLNSLTAIFTVERERGITVKAQGLEHVILAHSGNQWAVEEVADEEETTQRSGGRRRDPHFYTTDATSKVQCVQLKKAYSDFKTMSPLIFFIHFSAKFLENRGSLLRMNLAMNSDYLGCWICGFDREGFDAKNGYIL
ncbi:hypothetical protein LXL04_003056 [Taraxacum kok-saghyz]